MKKVTNQKGIVPAELAKEIAELEQLVDAPVDTTDIPDDIDWSKKVVGRFHRVQSPEAVIVRLESDVAAWFGPDDLDEAVNEALRTYIREHQSAR